ncbi:MAG: response regulator [Myxococcales bacterium]|nr:response regulator [Myxococcales bacterium]
MPKILLVEDNEMNRDMLSRRLRRRGYEVDVAVDGGEAVDMARTMPDLMLLDMSLPVMDGWAVATRLKGDDETRRIPIIALTAHAMVGDKEKALAAGCDDYETKPIDFPRLLDKINELIAPN